jgi:hypothetical protein
VCPGDGEDVKPCNSNKCPGILKVFILHLLILILCSCTELTPWTTWTPCSKSCGTGERSRTRECKVLPGVRDTNACGGAPLFERETCNTQKCPIYTEWSEWTECSVTCGGGQQSRSRSCVLPPILPWYSAEDLICDGPPKETR